MVLWAWPVCPQAETRGGEEIPWVPYHSRRPLALAGLPRRLPASSLPARPTFPRTRKVQCAQAPQPPSKRRQSWTSIPSLRLPCHWHNLLFPPFQAGWPPAYARPCRPTSSTTRSPVTQSGPAPARYPRRGQKARSGHSGGFRHYLHAPSILLIPALRTLVRLLLGDLGRP